MPYYINIFAEMISPIGVTVDFDWYEGAEGGDRIDNNSVTMASGSGGNIARGSFPVISSWVEITVRLTAAVPVNNFLADIWLSAVPTQGDGVSSSASNILLSEEDFTLTTGVMETFEPGQVRWGWGYWSAHVVNPATMAAATNWIARLYSLSRTGSAILLDAVGAGALWSPRLILLPSNMIRVEVEQNDGADRSLYLVTRFHPGPL
ncbi:MAG TPA: hypothetical protein VM656_09550 [Pyrinomonadaceae bacterium]|nr:hypothetical protein [Pyrinomonadaceae bacterium]